MEGRGLLFWGVCMPLRAGIALHATRDSRLVRLFAAAIGARWMMGLENGNEGMFGGPTWWADERRVHGALWAAYALCGDNKFLLLDTGYGAWNWLKRENLLTLTLMSQTAFIDPNDPFTVYIPDGVVSGMVQRDTVQAYLDQAMEAIAETERLTRHAELQTAETRRAAVQSEAQPLLLT